MAAAARTTALGRLPGASFAGFRFPVREVHVRGSLRHHLHEYPHSPGAALEGLGRKLYEFRMTAPFHETFRAYPKLYPETLASLRTIFEGGLAWDLVVPSIGTLQARCIDWTQHLVAKVQSGEDVEFVFLEDRDEAFLIDKLVTTSTDLVPPGETLRVRVATRNTAELLTTADDLTRAAVLGREAALFDRLMKTVELLTSLDDQAELYSSLVATKASDVIRLCEEIDHSAPTLNDPRSFLVVDALHDLWASAQRLHDDAMKRNRTVSVFETSTRLSVVQLSALLYGDTSRTLEVLRLNDFDDALSIPAHSSVRYYAA